MQGVDLYAAQPLDPGTPLQRDIQEKSGLSDFFYHCTRHTAETRLAALGVTNARVLHADGTKGWPEHAPYPAILVSAGAAEIPPALLAQLDLGGRLVVPVGPSPGVQTLTRVTREGPRDYRHERLDFVVFVPLVPSEA